MRVSRDVTVQAAFAFEVLHILGPAHKRQIDEIEGSEIKLDISFSD